MIHSVLWSELLPGAFSARLDACPLAYLPLGLCEPHGHIAAFGLDTLKAEWLCRQSAQKNGGIVAPTQGWHIHESGYHAPWLADVVGEENPRLGTLPPDVVLKGFLFQLRAFANAGFRAAIGITGHVGGNERDLRRVGAAFEAQFGLTVRVAGDPELTGGRFSGDHAGRYEISQLLYIRPDLVDLSLLPANLQRAEGQRLALGSDAAEASPELGAEIMAACLHGLTQLVGEALEAAQAHPPRAKRLSLAEVEGLWRELEGEAWETGQLKPGQRLAAAGSQWNDEA